MAGDNRGRGPLWVDGRFTIRVRGPGPAPGRVVRLRGPFAAIGRDPGADIRLDDPEVDPRHALLLLDRRGVFGLDLLSRAGTRFAGGPSAATWLGAGDILEVAGRRIELLQLRIDGAIVDPPLSTDDPLSDADGPGLVGLAIEPIGPGGPPWMIGSELAIVGGDPACALRVEGASPTHCALLRGPAGAYLIGLPGCPTLVNGRPVPGASALIDGDVLTIGEARFAVRIGPTPPDVAGPPPTGPAGIARSDLPATADGTAAGARELGRSEVLGLLRRFQVEAAALLGAQADRIEALDREVAALRDEIRGRTAPPDGALAPLRIGPPPRTPAESAESAAWILDRLGVLDDAGRPGWKDLLRRIAATVAPGPAPGPGRSIVLAARKPPGPGPS